MGTLGFFVFLPASRGEQPNPLFNLAMIPFLVFSLVYEGLMLQFKNGQTLGKMATKVRVVRPDGSPISPVRPGGVRSCARSWDAW